MSARQILYVDASAVVESVAEASVGLIFKLTFKFAHLLLKLGNLPLLSALDPRNLLLHGPVLVAIFALIFEVVNLLLLQQK